MLRRLFCLLLAALPLPAALAAATVGQAAPDFTLPDVNGKTVRLSDFRGRHVVLEWVNPGCPFVQKHYRSNNMQKLHQEATALGVVWLAIDSTEPEHGDYLSPSQLARWMREQQGTPTLMLKDEDGRTGQSYGARVTPHMFLIDPQGRLLYAGGIDSIASPRIEDIARATNYVRQGLAEALTGKPLSTPTSRPYGCSIKYRS